MSSSCQFCAFRGPTTNTLIPQDGRELSSTACCDELPHHHCHDELCLPKLGAKINPSSFKLFLSYILLFWHSGEMGNYPVNSYCLGICIWALSSGSKILPWLKTDHLGTKQTQLSSSLDSWRYADFLQLDHKNSCVSEFMLLPNWDLPIKSRFVNSKEEDRSLQLLSYPELSFLIRYLSIPI